MNRHHWITFVVVLFAASLVFAEERTADDRIRRLLYVTAPDGAGGSRNRPGIYVFDIDDGHKLVKYVPVAGMGPTRGCCGSVGGGGRLFISHKNTNLLCFDLVTDEKVWEVSYPKDQGGADRCCVTPDGRKLYVPEGWWTSSLRAMKVVNGSTGALCTPSRQTRVLGEIHDSGIMALGTATYTHWRKCCCEQTVYVCMLARHFTVDLPSGRRRNYNAQQRLTGGSRPP